MSYKFCKKCKDYKVFLDAELSDLVEGNLISISKTCSECGSKYEFTNKDKIADEVDNMQKLQ